MKRSHAGALAGFLVVTGGLIFLLDSREPSQAAANAIPGPTPPNRFRTTRPDPGKERATRDEFSRKTIQTDWQELMAWLGSDPAPTDREIQARLLAIRVSWTAMDLQVLAEMIARLLAGGEDRPTGLAFRVGPHGFLKGWPTLRVFLLDVLAASDPEMAAATAREVLNATSSGDEFAVGLRSLTREGLGRATDAELLSRFAGMLGHGEWRNSGGFAEAFDLPRLLGSAEAAGALIGWQGNQVLRHQALNEFAAEHPRETLAALENAGGIDSATRASLMARANPADPAQLAAVDAYLRRSDLPPGEAAAFLDAFPLRSATTGFRLYGESPAPYSYGSIVAGDRSALEQVGRWLADPQLANHRDELESLKQRLQEWAEQTR